MHNSTKKPINNKMHRTSSSTSNNAIRHRGSSRSGAAHASTEGTRDSQIAKNNLFSVQKKVKRSKQGRSASIRGKSALDFISADTLLLKEEQLLEALRQIHELYIVRPNTEQQSRIYALRGELNSCRAQIKECIKLGIDLGDPLEQEEPEFTGFSMLDRAFI